MRVLLVALRRMVLLRVVRKWRRRLRLMLVRDQRWKVRPLLRSKRPNTAIAADGPPGAFRKWWALIGVRRRSAFRILTTPFDSTCRERESMSDTKLTLWNSSKFHAHNKLHRATSRCLLTQKQEQQRHIW